MPLDPPRLAADDEPDDRYFDLDALARYAGLSARTLRRYMDDPINPLPTHHVHASGRDRGRVLVSRRAFDAWVTSFPPLRSAIAPARPAAARAAAWARKLAKTK